eukprot:comp21416_c0_seq1/m.29514 comp21416_c0_seq1/g.29514  ORF comp21416_c0_seq1/g.29514 comp21416_c0_seq1/m.29514 type:complete len:782 (-) comp21416_c0_seq1:235-2580(-)
MSSASNRSAASSMASSTMSLRSGPSTSTRMRQKFKVAKCPSDALALFNCVVANPADFEPGTYILVQPEHNPAGYAMNVKTDSSVQQGTLGFTFHQRKWAELALNKEIDVTIFDPTSSSYPYISSITLEVDLLAKKGKPPSDPLVGHEMSKAFIEAFSNMVFSVGQQIVFDYRSTNLLLQVKDIEIISLAKLQKLATMGEDDDKSDADGIKGQMGVLMSQTSATFDKAEGSSIVLIGTAKGSARTTLINPDWNFEQMGIGGLDKEFSAIFRRAFASRVFPPDLVKQLGIQHVKGILLYGPPGTGKTLMARQIGKMLNAVEPKIVNGPEILNKYVGQSEENIRNLFKDAEAEQAAKGDYSQLHIIIFDEIDAICKQRGGRGDSTGVHDTVVNQLLSKIDGVDQLNNILVIGMTNRKDLIDEALLRPGRLEVQMEINLPDEHGRLQILNIHTSEMKQHNKIDPNVNVPELASLTKNFSGAEIAGLVKSASSFALNRHVNASNLLQFDAKAAKELKVTMDDFMYALDEVKPAFGVAEDEFSDCLANGIIQWGSAVDQIVTDGRLFVDQVRNSPRTPLVSVLLEGAPGSGKTALAATIAMNSDFPFVKLITPESYVGMSESAKCNALTKVFDDAYKSPSSIIVLDNLERLLEYVPIGPRFSNTVLQTLLVLINKHPKHQRRLLVLATTSQRQVLVDMGMMDVFNAVVHVPQLTAIDQVKIVLRDINLFDTEQLDKVESSLASSPLKIHISIKNLIMLSEMARQDEDQKMEKFLHSFRAECIKNQPY